ncbi:hypothetical protein F511_10901 [Dorcoceras hygrometricum]|uniref:Retrovirus-related Pol polyprotein from transposon TNT 1-94-like beta-barrel domain-containing protein n=1 Tax=Dorcoceras hygrometricum TaxID=472368 RepID=A0A2Z7CQK4_9LAMI|nr:hypothetical protein F511_10901 [Dorcoceras hygrometricum]
MLKEKSSTVPEVSALISGHPATEVPALVSRNIGKFANHQSRPGPKGEGVKCEYCNKPNHTKETCWDLHGKPPNWKPRFQKQKGRESRAHQSGVEEEAGVFSGMPTFSKEQLGQLYRLLQSPQFTKPVPVASSSSVAQQGSSSFQPMALHVFSPDIPWIVDSGATDHMTGSYGLFSSYAPCAGNKKIRIADGSLSPIAGIGSITISKTLTLHDVLHVPNLSCNLLSVSKLTTDLKCCVLFSPHLCQFQDSASGMMIGSAREDGGLYYFEAHPSHRQAQQSSVEPHSCPEDIMLYIVG